MFTRSNPAHNPVPYVPHTKPPLPPSNPKGKNAYYIAAAAAALVAAALIHTFV